MSTLNDLERSVIRVKRKGKLLRELNLTELDTFLRSLAQLVGIGPANQPDVNAMKLLMNSVIGLYGHLTNEEVKNAFNLLIAGEYEIDGHYQSFSAKYFSDVIKAYLSYATKILKDLPAEVKELPPVPIKDEQWIEEAYLSWRTLKNRNYNFIDPFVYDKLRKKGLISLTQDQKTRIKEQVERDLKELSEKKDFRALDERMEFVRSDLPKEEFIQEKCKKYAVAEFFNELIRQEKLSVL